MISEATTGPNADSVRLLTSGFSRSGSDCHQPLSAASRVRPAS